MKKLLCTLVAVVLSLAVFTSAFAAEPEVITSTVTSSSSSTEVEPRSTISGYAHMTVRNSYPIPIRASASGWGGMGVTIKFNTNQTYNNVRTIIYVSNGIFHSGSSYTTFDGNININGNNEIYFNDLSHDSPEYVVIAFPGLPDGVSLDCEVWIYG